MCPDIRGFLYRPFGFGPRMPPITQVTRPAARRSGRIKKPRCLKHGVALRQIRRYQKSTDLHRRLLPFRRLVKEIVEQSKFDLRSKGSTVQEGPESYLVVRFQGVKSCAVKPKQVTMILNISSPSEERELIRQIRNPT